jgi:hypothetical protein
MLTRWLPMVVCLLTACHSETKADAHFDETGQENSTKTTEETGALTKRQDASDVDTKTTRSDNAIVVQDADGGISVVSVPKREPLVLKKGAKVVGTVALAQTVTEQSRHIGAVETDKMNVKKSTEADDKAKVVKVDAKTEKMADVGFSLKFYLLAGGVLAAVVALGLFLSHSTTIRRLLGVPL